MKAVLLLYNTLLIVLACLCCPIWLALVCLREKYRKTFIGRLWMQSLKCSTPTEVWIHALSVGEVLSAEPLVKALAGKYGSENLVFTASTHTGHQTAMRVIAPHVRAVRHFPYDTIFSVNRALRVIQPRKVVIVETDLWPNFLFRMSRCRIPVYLANARLSGRSFRGYKRIAFVMLPLLSIFRRICVQAERDRDRFLDLGLPAEKVVIAGNLKFDQPPVSLSDDERGQLQTVLGLRAGESVWVAGSTHPHEEAILGRALLQLREHGVDVTLILAPRDPKRAADVCDELRRLGVEAMTLGQLEGQARPPEAVVAIDRIGILRQLYALADVTFVGGSLVNEGGHNPLEPASVARPVLFGPYTDDFDWISRTLEREGGALRVSEAPQLGAAIETLLKDKARCARVGKLAQGVFEAHQGAVARTLAIVGEHST